jgi:hypothetical protein
MVPFLSDFLSTVKVLSEALDNLLQPRSECVSSKRISLFSEADRVSKEAWLVRK